MTLMRAWLDSLSAYGIPVFIIERPLTIRINNTQGDLQLLRGALKEAE